MEIPKAAIVTWRRTQIQPGRFSYPIPGVRFWRFAEVPSSYWFQVEVGIGTGYEQPHTSYICRDFSTVEHLLVCNRAKRWVAVRMYTRIHSRDSMYGYLFETVRKAYMLKDGTRLFLLESGLMVNEDCIDVERTFDLSDAKEIYSGWR